MRLINVLLALLVSLLIALAVFEGGLRLIGMGPPTTLNTFDPDTGWGNKRAAHLTTSTPDGGRVHFDFNAFGLRESDQVQPTKPAGVRRVIALGDSFTLGRYVEQKDLFLDRLEAMFDEVQIVNTGSEGFATDQEVAWLLAHGAEWKPDLVLLFPYENDLYWCGEEDYTGYAKPRFEPSGELEERELPNRLHRGLLGRSAIGRLLRGRPQVPTFKPGSRSIPREFAVVLDELPAFMEEPMARAEGALRALVRRTEELGAELVICPIPAETAIHPRERERFERGLGLGSVGWSGDNAVERFRRLALDAGIPEERILDVRPRFHQLADDGEVLYFDRDWHLNEKGNEELARFLSEELPRLDLLPAPQRDLAPLAVTEPSAGLPTWLLAFAGLWAVLGTIYSITYRRDEKPPLAFVKVGLMLAVVFGLAIGGSHLLALLPPSLMRLAAIAIVLAILGFVVYKLGDRLGTIVELLTAFTRRGHWYLLPLVVVLLSVGSLLVVAASSPLVAPFIYTLF